MFDEKAKAKPTPAGAPLGVRKSPLDTTARDAQREAQYKAMDALTKKREAIAKKTGVWPNFGTN